MKKSLRLQKYLARLNHNVHSGKGSGMHLHAGVPGQPRPVLQSGHIFVRLVLGTVLMACSQATAQGQESVAQLQERAALEAAPAVALATEVPQPPQHLDFREIFQRGLETFDVSAGAIGQHDLPSGPRSDLKGDRLSVAWRRFSSPRVEKGPELTLSTLENGTHGTKAWGLVYARRQYFHVRSDHALHWSVGAGLCHLTSLVPEQGSHTNFTEELGVGYMHRAGRRTAWTAEYRFAHISDGGRSDPNIGLNCSILTLGWRLHY